MLKKNNLPFGILIGLIFPTLAFIAAYLLRYNVYIINKPGIPYFIAIALNLILIRVGSKKELDQTIKGIMLATFVCMVVVFLFKIHPIR
ncbi:hypothetical protein HDF24_05790 [Mucilaginibacter sp. X4EP1]|uniref:hypothetical protein n=1 Tax=Mucilaginibacter sp. X4EP1 TaxID=2723092 RepID=UPI00216A51C8|nr:hypothetical protein [Mucilaginibacter sp. X4EP1]MCS3814391.1 hypothetical protein [Mucilaginibacter sp. X4EP1]